MNQNQIKKKKLFELDQLELGNPIAIIKFDVIKVIAKTENKIESKLKIAKDSLSKIILSFTLSKLFKNHPFPSN